MHSPSWKRFTLYTLFCLIILSHLRHGQAAKVKILGLDSANKIKNDFLIVFKLSASNCSARLDEFSQWMRQEVNSGSEQRRFIFGNFVAMRYSVDEAFVAKMADHTQVRFIEANQKVQLATSVDQKAEVSKVECVSQNSGSSLWGLSRISSRAKPEYGSAQYSYLSNDGEGVDVYVVDTGIYADHEEFENNAKVVFVSSSLKSSGAVDQNGHGTHVAGTIAGKTYGVCKQCNILSVRVLDKDGVGTTADVLEGLEWIYTDFTKKKQGKGKKMKAVASMSLGGAPGVVDTLDEAAITMATDAGLPFVVAAGNDNSDACRSSPARLSAAITVSAIDSSDAMSSYSNYGPCVDILAPGDKILSSYIGSTSSSATLSGTSMAVPHVTGVVARYLSQTCLMPSPVMIKAWLQDTATKNVVTVKGQSTQNLLVYVSCVADGANNVDVVNLSGNMLDLQMRRDDDRFIFVFAALLALLLLSLLATTVSCCVNSNVKKLKRQMSSIQSCVQRNNQAYHTFEGCQNQGYHSTFTPTAAPPYQGTYPSAPDEGRRLIG